MREHILCVASNNWGSFTSNSSTLTLDTVPSISISPLTVNQCPGTKVNFTAKARGSIQINLQWYKQIFEIYRATDSVYKINNLHLKDANTYYCIASNACGSQMSSVATLTVDSFAITSQPANISIHAGSIAIFSVNTY